MVLMWTFRLGLLPKDGNTKYRAVILPVSIPEQIWSKGEVLEALLLESMLST